MKRKLLIIAALALSIGVSAQTTTKPSGTVSLSPTYLVNPTTDSIYIERQTSPKKYFTIPTWASVLKKFNSIDLTPYALDANVLHKTGNETKVGNLTLGGGTGTLFSYAVEASDYMSSVNGFYSGASGFSPQGFSIGSFRTNNVSPSPRTPSLFFDSKTGLGGTLLATAKLMFDDYSHAGEKAFYVAFDPDGDGSFETEKRVLTEGDDALLTNVIHKTGDETKYGKLSSSYGIGGTDYNGLNVQNTSGDGSAGIALTSGGNTMYMYQIGDAGDIYGAQYNNISKFISYTASGLGDMRFGVNGEQLKLSSTHNKSFVAPTESEDIIRLGDMTNLPSAIISRSQLSVYDGSPNYFYAYKDMMGLVNSSGWDTNIKNSNGTSNHSIELPDASGTIALSENVVSKTGGVAENINGNKTFSNTTTINTDPNNEAWALKLAGGYHLQFNKWDNVNTEVGRITDLLSLQDFSGDKMLALSSSNTTGLYGSKLELGTTRDGVGGIQNFYGGRFNFISNSDQLSGNSNLLEMGLLSATSGVATNYLKANNTDIEVTDLTKGVVLKSPDGTRWRVTISNAGVLTTTAL